MEFSLHMTALYETENSPVYLRKAEKIIDMLIGFRIKSYRKGREISLPFFLTKNKVIFLI